MRNRNARLIASAAIVGVGWSLEKYARTILQAEINATGKASPVSILSYGVIAAMLLNTCAKAISLACAKPRKPLRQEFLCEKHRKLATQEALAEDKKEHIVTVTKVSLTPIKEPKPTKAKHYRPDAPSPTLFSSISAASTLVADRERAIEEKRAAIRAEAALADAASQAQIAANKASKEMRREETLAKRKARRG